MHCIICEMKDADHSSALGCIRALQAALDQANTTAAEAEAVGYAKGMAAAQHHQEERPYVH